MRLQKDTKFSHFFKKFCSRNGESIKAMGTDFLPQGRNKKECWKLAKSGLHVIEETDRGCNGVPSSVKWCWASLIVIQRERQFSFSRNVIQWAGKPCPWCLCSGVWGCCAIMGLKEELGVPGGQSVPREQLATAHLVWTQVCQVRGPNGEGLGEKYRVRKARVFTGEFKGTVVWESPGTQRNQARIEDSSMLDRSGKVWGPIIVLPGD